MKKWHCLSLICVGVTVLVACMISLKQNEIFQVDIATVTMGPIINDIKAIGRVEALSEAKLKAYEQMRVKRVLVEAGDVVKTGDLLIEIDMTIKKEALEKAKLKVEQTDIRIEEAKRKISVSDQTWFEPSEMLKYLKDKEDLFKAASIEKEAAQREVNIATELLSVGAESSLQHKIKEDKLKDAKIKLEQARRQLREATQSYNKKEKTSINLLSRQIEYQIALKEKDIAEAEFTIAVSELERMRVVSPIDGSVTSVEAKDNTYVKQGDDLVTIADLSELQARAELDEIDATLVKAGQQAIITFQGHANRKIKGQVKTVAPVAQVIKNRTIVDVLISIIDDSGLLRIANQVDAQIVIDKREKVVRLPMGALYDAKPPYIFRQHEGIAKKVEVQTGLSDTNYIEVISGLTEGAAVIVGHPTDIYDGARIMASTN